jgi:hypothetical protein
MHGLHTLLKFFALPELVEGKLTRGSTPALENCAGQASSPSGQVLPIPLAEPVEARREMFMAC